VEYPRIVYASDGELIPAAHEDPLNPGSLKRVIADKSMFPVGRVQMLNWALLPAGKEFREHYHEDMLEIFVVTQGKVSVASGSVKGELGVGDAWFVPAGVRHKMRNHSGEDALYIVFGVSSEQGGKTIVTELW
jgi:mannose-6-phosphate isomerase-like protein (cupin superfamily)